MLYIECVRLFRLTAARCHRTSSNRSSSTSRCTAPAPLRASCSSLFHHSSLSAPLLRGTRLRIASTSDDPFAAGSLSFSLLPSANMQAVQPTPTTAALHRFLRLPSTVFFLFAQFLPLPDKLLQLTHIARACPALTPQSFACDTLAWTADPAHQADGVATSFAADCHRPPEL